MQIEIKLENGRTLEEELDVIHKMVHQVKGDYKFIEDTVRSQNKNIAELKDINNKYLQQIIELQSEENKENRSLLQRLFPFVGQDKKSRLTKTTIDLESKEDV